MCINGTWSCIYLNGTCNADCFFCPQGLGDGTKDRLVHDFGDFAFENVGQYLDFLDKFKVKGVGISGGDPLMTFDLLLEYIKGIKKKFGDDQYVWLYTNGLLLTPAKVKKLNSIGLDEIRLNIAAGGYELEPVRTALMSIGTVTVEIPMIPEDFDIVRKLIPKLFSMGVKHMNIHQLFTAENNKQKFEEKMYSLESYKDKYIVIESDDCAIKLLKEFVGLGYSLNYCSLPYKYVFQNAGLRRRLASFFNLEVTQTGFLRDKFSNKMRLRGLNYYRPYIESEHKKENKTLFGKPFRVKKELFRRISLKSLLEIEYLKKDMVDKFPKNILKMEKLGKYK